MMTGVWEPGARLGATYLGKGTAQVVVWAPRASRADLHIVSERRILPMRPIGRGYFEISVDGIAPGARYLFRLNGELERPDPASRFQPEGVHGPSELVDTAFEWHDRLWSGIPLQDYIIYELHVGTFTPGGTFDAIIPHLERLVRLGVTAVELMPVAQFPGDRNWGYDGVYPFAVQNSYGGPWGLKRLVDACHRHGLAVILDVVYNHFGPEGNYFPDFGPYLTEKYKTPWGPAVNYDGEGSDQVRRFFLENARMWVQEFHIDALRLDAVDNMYDFSARTFLQELREAMDELEERQRRKIHLMVEQDLNLPRFVQARPFGGDGLDAQWTDDFHHALFTLLTGDVSSYYVDFTPDPAQPVSLLAKALREGYVYTGEYSRYRGHKRGAPALDLPGYRHVVFAQNHDQIGNRMLGERLGHLVSFEALKLAAGVVILSPYIPLLWMGEEYGETAPFLYFVSHSDPELVRAVQQGRRDYFGAGDGNIEPPDPLDERTFLRSKLGQSLVQQGVHCVLHDFYAELIRLRKTVPALRYLSKRTIEVSTPGDGKMILWRRWDETNQSQAVAVFNFADQTETVALPLPDGKWELGLYSGARRWQPDRAHALQVIEPPQSVEATDHVQVQIAPLSFLVYLLRP